MTGSIRRADLSVGEIEYLDTQGTGPIIVLLHGLLMDETLWTDVIEELASHTRCVAPVLPLGAHRLPIAEGADLSMRGVAAIVSELMDHLNLRDVTLVGSDTGGAIVQVLVADGDRSRVAKIALVSCDAFENFPPGLTGRTIVATGRLPPRLFGLFMQQLRLRLLRRLPIAFGWLTSRGDATTRRWLDPVLRHHSIRVDAVRVLRSIRRDRGLLDDVASRLAQTRLPALVIWADGDRVMPPDHGSRLAQLLRAPHEIVADSYTLVPLDQPRALASLLKEFTIGPVPTPEGPGGM